ncbi:MAG TPA: hypothetical protein V6D18_11955 [Thermosynechococcaceae cyanobacterium]
MPLDEPGSLELAERIRSKPRSPFDNAYRAAIATPGAVYVQGFLVIQGKSGEPIEHGWIELDARLLDPSLPHLKRSADDLHYFPAQRLSVKQLKAIVEESQEDYPEDDPLPVHGGPPYEYYGDVMLGGRDYAEAQAAAEAKQQALKHR